MKCNACGKVFARSDSLRRHQLTACRKNCGEPRSIPKKRVNLVQGVKQTTKMKCNACGKVFARSDSLQRHQVTTCENNCAEPCPIPKKRLKTLNMEVLDSNVTKLHHAFKNRIASYRFSGRCKLNHDDFFTEIKEKVLDRLEDYLHIHNCVKVNFELFAIYLKPENRLSDIKSMNTANKVLTQSTNVNEVYQEFKDEIMNQASEFQEKDSGWALQEIMFLDVNINRFCAISASSYIRLPQQIQQKNAVLNIRNSDHACFAWCVNASIFQADGHPTDPESYPHFDTLLDFSGIEFPVTLKNINTFEKLNNISVNVYGVESEFINGKKRYEIVGPLHFTSNRKPTHVNLLLISDTDRNTHYTLIKNLSRLVTSQKTRHKEAAYLCDGCLQSFSTNEKLQQHQEHDCCHVYTKLPTTDLKINKFGEWQLENILKFQNFEKQLQVPFVIYADFESLLKPIDHSEPYDGNSFTVKVCEHEPYSFAFYVKCTYDDGLSRFESYEGIDAAKVFIEKLDATVHDLYNRHLKHVKPMRPLTLEEQRRYNSATTCHICENPFDVFDKKVRDHSHVTGRFTNAAHSTCNLNYKLSKSIPVFFHNLTNYDCHLFIKELATKGENISAIPQTKEKYISFSKSILVEKFKDPKIRDVYMTLRFVDSFRFLSGSLEKLAETLTTKQCTEITKFFPENVDLMRQKGVFPYSYVDSFNKLREQQLPSKEQFYDKLRGENISDEDYTRAQLVWNTFNCQTISDYGLLYLKTDVLLLADVFENFRKVCLATYKLDPAHYLTAPSLSWDAMLRHTKVELQLLTDVDMLHFFKKGIRGGVAQCSKRMSVANNEYLKNYDTTKPKSFIAYLDATNLYGAAMNEYLPNGNFRWLTETEIEHLNVENVANTSSMGYVLEVDLEYPTSLHDAHNDLPFCPENITPPKSKYPKLIPSLYGKTKYIIHYQNLKQCLRYGLKLTKIHRVIEFTQSAWLKPYIQLNTSLRNQAKNDFEKDLFKLFINAIFGKTLENVEKRKRIVLSSHWENTRGSLGAKTLIAKPEFKSCSVFSDNLVAIQLNKIKVVYDKPMYIGFSILDISKTIMYDFYYGYIKTKYGDSAKLCYTDTDSLVLEVFTDNFYKDMKENIQYFDTSNYPAENIHGIPKTVSVVGKMKDEFGGVPVESFYGTGAKAYCVKLSQPVKNGDIVKKAKGVSKHVIKNKIHLNDYKQIIETGGTIFRRMYIFTSNLHTIYTELKNKVALSSKDDKRYVIPNDVNTLSWGHLLINPTCRSGTIDDLLQAACEEEDNVFGSLDFEEHLENFNDINLEDYLEDFSSLDFTDNIDL